jgi:hypothetical protein
MTKKRKIATNLPDDLLREAQEATGLNQTQTLVEALKELVAAHKRARLLSLRGKLHFTYDSNESRKRRVT